MLQAAEVFTDLTWATPTFKTDGTSLLASDILGYRVFESTDNLSYTQITDIPGSVTHTEIVGGAATSYTASYDLPIVETPYTYYYKVVVVANCYNQDGTTYECESTDSNVVQKSFLLESTAQPTAPGSVDGSMRCGPGCVVTEQPITGFNFNIDFNSGTLGTRVDDVNPIYDTFTSDAGGSFYTADVVAEGTQAAELNIAKGTEGSGSWGGILQFPDPLVQGDELWIRVKTYWPSTTTYLAESRLKFLRIRTESPTGINRGYNDWYINPEDRHPTPFQWIKEINDSWRYFGATTDKIAYDTWETYELYLKFDSVPSASGGTALVRMWKNGVLIGEITDVPTLQDAADLAKSFYLFTYWNHDAFQKLYELTAVPSTPFIPGEVVTGSISSNPVTLNVMDLTNNADLFVINNARNGIPDYVVGETVTGSTSGAIGVISAIKWASPYKDVRMYVDDIIVTTQTPASVDAAGNPIIGL